VRRSRPATRMRRTRPPNPVAQRPGPLRCEGRAAPPSSTACGLLLPASVPGNLLGRPGWELEVHLWSARGPSRGKARRRENRRGQELAEDREDGQDQDRCRRRRPETEGRPSWMPRARESGQEDDAPPHQGERGQQPPEGEGPEAVGREPHRGEEGRAGSLEDEGRHRQGDEERPPPRDGVPEAAGPAPRRGEEVRAVLGRLRRRLRSDLGELGSRPGRPVRARCRRARVSTREPATTALPKTARRASANAS